VQRLRKPLQLEGPAYHSTVTITRCFRRPPSALTVRAETTPAVQVALRLWCLAGWRAHMEHSARGGPTQPWADDGRPSWWVVHPVYCGSAATCIPSWSSPG
jgi:hypothetical protein